MPRSRPGLLASIGAAAVLAVPALLAAQAQPAGEAPFGLRSTFDAGGAAAPTGAAARRERERARARRQAADAVPRYGNAPASGAGVTGFDSTNARRSGGPPPRQAAPAAAPLDLTPKARPLSLAEAASASAAPAVPPAPLAKPRRSGQEKREEGLVMPGPDLRGPIRQRAPREEDAFEATGIRVGSFILRPAIEVGTGYNDNPGGTPGGRGAAVTVVAPELIARSTWSRHEMAAVLRGSYTAYDRISSINRPSFDGRLTGRIDVTRDTRIELEGRTIVGTDNPNSPNLQAGLARLPLFTDIGGSVGVAHRFNRFEVSLKGSVDRTTYEDSKLTDGTTVSNRDRNFEQYAAALRASYELTPGMKPFVEAIVDERLHDLAVDAFGFRRNSQAVTGRAGTTFEIARTLTGEVAAGYLTRRYADPALRDLQGAILDASLIWSATALTTVKLTALSGSDESTVPGVSGVFRRDYALQVDHALRRWLIATARLSYGTDDYEGSPRKDERYAASVAMTYKLNREVQLKGEYRREWLHSSVPGNDYTANIAMVGLRLQR